MAVLSRRHNIYRINRRYKRNGVPKNGPRLAAAAAAVAGCDASVAPAGRIQPGATHNRGLFHTRQNILPGMTSYFG